MTKADSSNPLEILVEGITDQGLVRQENQDYIQNAVLPLGTLLIVADGMGGYQGGGVASRLVVEEFVRVLSDQTPDADAHKVIREAAESANARIRQTISQPNFPYPQMGSTLVLALLQRKGEEYIAWIAHVGDSRAYLVRNQQMTKLTVDHSAVQDLINRQIITQEEAASHPQASVLTRCVGHLDEIEIDIDQISLQKDDLLMLCSDGLWGFVPDQEIQAAATAAGSQLDAIAKALLQLAVDHGAPDNVGIELARLSPAPPPPKRGFWRKLFGAAPK